jgi:hypothetical protein
MTATASSTAVLPTRHDLELDISQTPRFSAARARAIEAYVEEYPGSIPRNIELILREGRHINWGVAKPIQDALDKETFEYDRIPTLRALCIRAAFRY